ncbi:MAG: PorT family protein [Bacteroidales bacterium]|nr:PorT family protein [Bacteroidales bacterium]
MIEAQKLFKQGIIDEIDDVLQPCINRGFTHNQRSEAYKLIIYVSLLNGDQAKAESTMLSFLKENPKYEIMPDDPVEFVYFFEMYKSKSVFSVGFMSGPNFTNPSVKKSITSGDMNNTESSNQSGPGFHAGIAANRYISPHLFINLECNYIFNSYQFTDKYKKLGNFEVNPLYDIVVYKEKINRIEIPLSAGYETESRILRFTLKLEEVIVS